MKQIIILTIVGTFLLSCSHGDRQMSSPFINLDRQDKVSIFDIFESVDLVLLETTDESLISRISQVVHFNDRYYALDRAQSILFCFDSTGNFLFKISNQGQGPEEYIRIDNFNIDPHNNQLLLLEPWGVLHAYDLEGNFISKTRLPSEVVAYNEVFVLDENRLIFSNANLDELVFYNRIENAIYDRRYGLDMELRRKSESIFMPIRRTYSYAGDLFFSPKPSNEIINLSDSTIFVWNFGKQTNTKEIIEQLKKVILRSENNRFRPEPTQWEYDWVGENLLRNIPRANFETSRYKISVLSLGRGILKHVFFDKKTGKAFVFDQTTEGIRFSVPIFGNESVIAFCRGRAPGQRHDNPESRFLELYYHPSIFTEEQRRLYESRKEDDNPFLVRYNFKQWNDK